MNNVYQLHANSGQPDLQAVQLPNRDALTKREYQDLLRESYGVVPGMPEYFAKSREFMPLEVELGCEVMHGQPAVWFPAFMLNSFLSVFGASGSGKTELLKRLALEFTQHAIPVLIFDLHGDVEAPYVQEVVMSGGFGSAVGINPLSIEGLNPETHGLSDHWVEIVAMLRRAAPSLSQKQGHLIHEAMHTAYAMVGIEARDPRTWSLPPPTFGHVQHVLASWASDPDMKGMRDSINGCIAVLSAIFGHPLFQRGRVISVSEMLSGNWRLNLQHLPEPIQVIVVDTVLRLVFRRLRAMGSVKPGIGRMADPCRLFVVIDEAKVIAGGQGDPNKSTRILNVIATEGRKFGLGMVLASQSCEHFGADVLRNFATRVVLQTLDEREARANAKDMRLTSDQIMRLAGRGDAYFKTSGSEHPVRIQVTPIG